MKILLLIALVNSLNNHLLASVGSKLRHTVSNFGNNYIYVINAANGSGESNGYCYYIAEDGKAELKWKTFGFYAFPAQLILLDDGSHLLRLKDLHKINIKGDSTLIEIYKDGVLKYEITAESLVKTDNSIKSDPQNIESSIIANSLGENVVQLKSFEASILVPSQDIKNKIIKDHCFVTIQTFDGYISVIDLNTGIVLGKYKKTSN